MSGLSDGTGDYARSDNNYNKRRSNARNHYIKSFYKVKKGLDVDPDTGEILSYKPPRSASMKFAMANTFRNIKAPPAGAVLNFAMIAAVFGGGYLVYKKFISPLLSPSLDDMLSSKQVVADKATAAAFVDAQSNKAQVAQNTATSMSQSGLQVGSLHQSLANSLYAWIDTDGIVDGNKIVKSINGMADETFKLVSIAYGQRDLTKYSESITHFFNLASWTDWGNEKRHVGTLKDHLMIVLSSSEQSQIAHKLSLVS